MPLVRMSGQCYEPWTKSEPLAELNPRPLEPFEIPPIPESLPNLPSPQRAGLLGPSWSLTTHIIPAAFPRRTPDVTTPNLPVFSGDKERFKTQVSQTVKEILGTREKQWANQLTPGGSMTQLWNCINRFMKKYPQGNIGRRGLTLFFAHANGFGKELWEPTLRYLVTEIEQNGLDVAEIWVWEAVNHGDSSVINAGKLGGLYDWADNARDILHFFLYYLPSSAHEAVLPTHLLRLPESQAISRKYSGFQQRTLVAIGHSFGGCTSTLAALTYPELFSSVMLIDPVIRPIRPGQDYIQDSHFILVTGAISRRNWWLSRPEALASLKAIPFFAAWDPEVLDIYVEHGLLDDENGGVKLKTSGLNEALAFSEALTTYEVWQLLPTLDERVELAWIMPGKSFASIPGVKHELVYRRPANSSNVYIPEAGHLMVQESPKELATLIHEFLHSKYNSTRPRL